MSIEVIGYISDQEFLKELNVKTLDFVYYSNKNEASKKVTEMLRRVSRDCYACIHHGKLYYIGDENKLISEVKTLGDDIVKRYSTKPEEIALQPLRDRSHFHIARVLLYVGIRQSFKRNLFRVPEIEKRGEFFSKDHIIPKPNIYCHYGLKIRLDNTHEGHGILWMDMTLAAWQEIEEKLVGPLSYPKMKKLGILGIFKNYSQPRPRKRYEETLKIIEKIFGSKESFEVDMKTAGKITFRKLKLT